MQGKVVVIVGATGGIGSVLARKLASTGANLVLTARDSSQPSTVNSQQSMIIT
jgi:short-subunit dehydrogenase